MFAGNYGFKASNLLDSTKLHLLAKIQSEYTLEPQKKLKAGSELQPPLTNAERVGELAEKISEGDQQSNANNMYSQLQADTLKQQAEVPQVAAKSSI